MPARRARKRVLVGSSGVEPRGSGYRRRGLLATLWRAASELMTEFLALLILAIAAGIIFVGLAIAVVYLYTGRVG